MVVTGLEDVRKMLDDVSRKQIPYATKNAINNTANKVKANEVKEIEHVFDRPTRTTKNSVYISYAKKKELEATIGIKDKFKSGKGGMPASKYLEPHVVGGARRVKGSERQLKGTNILPRNKWLAHGKGARLNRAGNITHSQYVKMLSAVKGFTEKGYIANRPAAQNSAPFFIIPGVGLYKRTGKRTIKSQLVFVSKPKYEKRFDFYGIARRTFDRHFPQEWRAAFQHARATAH